VVKACPISLLPTVPTIDPSVFVDNPGSRPAATMASG
jgi:hypothetical protein